MWYVALFVVEVISGMTGDSVNITFQDGHGYRHSLDHYSDMKFLNEEPRVYTEEGHLFYELYTTEAECERESKELLPFALFIKCNWKEKVDG